MTSPAGIVRLGGSGTTGPLLVDLGTTTITGVTASAAPGLAARARLLGHQAMGTIALDDSVTRALGSDLARIGYAFDPPVLRDGVFVDPLGVTWLADGGLSAPVGHPLGGTARPRVGAHPMPVWPDRVQVPDGSPATGPAPASSQGDPESRLPAMTILDAPCPGLLETALALRGTWAFLDDLADDWRTATELLEWGLEMNVLAYEQALTALPAPPDVILLGDDYGDSRSMLISATDFRAHVRPRLRTLVARIRRLTPAAICFHSCGAIGPILADLADLELEILDLDAEAEGMQLATVRRALPAATVLHGWTDLGTLGDAVASGARTDIRRLAAGLARSVPTIAAPGDAVTTRGALEAAARGAAFVSALNGLEIDWSRMDGPSAVPEEALDHAQEVALASTVPVDCGDVPRTLSRAESAGRGQPSREPGPEPVLA